MKPNLEKEKRSPGRSVVERPRSFGMQVGSWREHMHTGHAYLLDLKGGRGRS
jgi:hypothetical protein